MKIIYVDDVVYHLKTTKERLKNYFDIIPAQSADELFEKLETMTPDLILLDINMPEVDGYETIKRMMENERYAKIPVIFLTAKAERKAILKGLELGAVDFVIKPYEDNALIERITYYLYPETRPESKPIVLAVDDSPSILKAINFLLNKDCVIYTLNEPDKIKSVLKIASPDLFLLDCKMPVMSGFELIPTIRDHKDHKETPIIFLTSEANFDTIAVARSLGACDFIVKPIDDEILYNKVMAHLDGFEIKRRLRGL
ncbi:MAG: response regulator [Defluviitaleaceae bacterium]|nr:response regulator [Defluviitaleaceae bacterium]